MPNGLSDDHHYIPRFWLRKWAGPDGRIRTYQRKHGRLVSERRVPKSVGKKPGLYTSGAVHTIASIRLEEAYFRQVDTRAYRVATKMLAGQVSELSLQERCAWAEFLVGLTYRTPNEVERSVNFLRQMHAPMLASLAEPNRRLGITDDRFTRWVTMQAMPTAIQQDTVKAGLASFHWAVIATHRTGVKLRLSDCPIVTHEPGIGLSHLSVPLSPDYLLMIAPTLEGLAHYHALDGAGLVRSINASLTRHAQLFVVSTNRQDEEEIERLFRP